MAFRYGERFLAGEDVRLAGKPFQQVVASGGSSVSTITDGGLAYRLHVFNASGDFTVTSPGVVEVEMIGGGGAGASTAGSSQHAGGGGGAGQYERFFATVTPGVYSIVVGAGGSIETGSARAGTRGNKTTGFGMTCIGGSGAVYDQTIADQMSHYCGACGGGMTTLAVYGLMSNTNMAGVIHTNGGDANKANNAQLGAGGGGGVGGNGGNAAQNVGGNGGVGIETFFTGVSTYLGGGGGGGCNGTTGGTRGLGGSSIGGNGALLTGPISSTAGTANTGSGGGGGAANTTVDLRAGGAGGSGVVRIRYRIG